MPPLRSNRKPLSLVKRKSRAYAPAPAAACESNRAWLQADGCIELLTIQLVANVLWRFEFLGLVKGAPISQFTGELLTAVLLQTQLTPHKLSLQPPRANRLGFHGARRSLPQVTAVEQSPIVHRLSTGFRTLVAVPTFSKPPLVHAFG